MLRHYLTLCRAEYFQTCRRMFTIFVATGELGWGAGRHVLATVSAFLAVSGAPRTVCGSGNDGFLTFTFRIIDASRIGIVVTSVHGQFFSTHRMYCTCVVNCRQGYFHTGSSNRPSNATNGPVLKRVGDTRLASVLVIMIHCFNNALLNADNLVRTCGASTTSIVDTTRVRRHVVRGRFMIRFNCSVRTPIVHVVGSFGLAIITLRRRVSYRTIVSVHLSGVPTMATHFNRLCDMIFGRYRARSRRLRRRWVGRCSAKSCESAGQIRSAWLRLLYTWFTGGRQLQI